ncbi:MAG: NDP-sugar synthase [Chloroflexi bacterium]|nr:NDP-sugar synthase [Chloroflexota bacterium]
MASEGKRSSEASMNAVILVGGEGTRLRPLTCNTPKAMVPVLNRPFLEHVLCQLKAHGVRTVVLALGHLSQPIEEYFGDGSNVGVNLVYSVEKEPLGTAGPVKLAEQYLDGRFLVLNGDVFADFDITSIVAAHGRSGAVATLALTPVEDPTIYGVVEMSAEGRVKRFVEKPRREEVTSNMINAGLYVMEPEVLSYIPAGTKVMFEHNVFPALLKAGKPMFGHAQTGYWIDIGTPQKYLQLNLDMLGKDAHAPQHPAGALVHPTARFSGSVLLPDDCIVGAGVRIAGPAVIGPSCQLGPGSVLSRSVLWSGSLLSENCSVSASVIADQCVIGTGAIIDNSVLGDHLAIAPGARIGPGVKLWPKTGCGAT